jgi:hypothetical protein
LEAWLPRIAVRTGCVIQQARPSGAFGDHGAAGRAAMRTSGSFHCAVRVGVAPWGEALNIHLYEFEFDPLGWSLWPEREDLSIELLRLLGAAQAGGSTIAECRVTAGRIDPSDDHSWYREWKSIADANCERGNAALREGHVSTAKSNWLRAINYYQSAAFPFDRDDGHCRAAIGSMRQCARDYLEYCDPRGGGFVDPLAGWVSAGGLFPAARGNSPAFAGNHLHGRARSAKGRVPP